MPEAKRRPYKELSLVQLRSFCAVCDRRSYAAAARALLLTSPAVWEQVRGLERHYGARLFDRDGSGVRPTVQGERLLALVRPHLAGLEAMRDVLQQEDGADPLWLTLVTNLRLLAEEISRAARRFRARHSGTRLRLIYTGIDEVEPRRGGRRPHAGAGTGPSAAAGRRLRARRGGVVFAGRAEPSPTHALPGAATGVDRAAPARPRRAGGVLPPPGGRGAAPPRPDRRSGYSGGNEQRRVHVFKRPCRARGRHNGRHRARAALPRARRPAADPVVRPGPRRLLVEARRVRPAGAAGARGRARCSVGR